MIFTLLGWALKLFGASAETNKKFLELIESTKNDGLITVQARDKFNSQRESILKKIGDRIENGGPKPPANP